MTLEDQLPAGALQQVTSDREDSEGTEAWPRKEDKAQTKAGCWDEQDVGK